MVRDRCSSYKIDYVVVIKNFLNTKGHLNPISGSKVTAILLKGQILPIGGASAGEGLRMQPAQQACLWTNFSKLITNLKTNFSSENLCQTKVHLLIGHIGHAETLLRSPRR